MGKLFFLVLTLYCNTIRSNQNFEYLDNLEFIKASVNPYFEFLDYKENCALSCMFIKKLINTFNIDVFFETGTHYGTTIHNVARYFKMIFTVELHDELFKLSKKSLANYPNVKSYHGKSFDIIQKIGPTIKDNVLFYLDAHYSGEGTALSNSDIKSSNAMTPICEELAAIKNANIKNCIILIDDIREFGSIINGQEYLGCWAYPTLQEIQNDLFKINPNFEFALLGDQFLAYDKTQYQPKFSKTVIACTKTRLYNGFNLSNEEFILLENDIMNASDHEKEYITHLYNWVTHLQQPMFWIDFWYGLVEVGSQTFKNAYIAFLKVNERTQYFNKNKLLPLVTLK